MPKGSTDMIAVFTRWRYLVFLQVSVRDDKTANLETKGFSGLSGRF